MSTPLVPLRPGEELIDVPSFEWIYSGSSAGAAAAPAGAARARALPERGAAAPAPRTERAEKLPQREAPARAASAAPAPAEAAPGRPAPPARAPALSAEDDALLRLGLRSISVAHRYASAAAFFVVRPGGVQLLCADGLAAPRPTLLQSTERWSAFAVAVETGKALRGAPKRDALARRVFRLLGRPDVREMGLFPALYKDRVVALLCVDHGSRRIGDASFDALRALAVRIGEAFARV